MATYHLDNLSPMEGDGETKILVNPVLNLQYHSRLLSRNGGEVPMDYRLRMILWIPTLAYAGFLMLGDKNLATLGQVVIAAFLGALLGFLVAIMFTLRQHRRGTRFAR
jgi:ABC-type phosphate/phosphonate transport system permease subunit